MSVKHNSELKFKVGLDENKVPEEISWSAKEGGINNEETKALVDLVCKTISNVPQGFSNLLKWLHGWSDEEGYHPGELELNKTLCKFFEEKILFILIFFIGNCSV